MIGSDKHIYVAGEPGLENLKESSLMSREELASDLELDIEKRWALCTLHSETMEEKIEYFRNELMFCGLKWQNAYNKLFELIAERIMKYQEVESVYLMSGGYDLCVIVKGKTFQEVAMFVAKELSTIDSVISTTTHFILRRYKELDVELIGKPTDDRGNFSL